MQNTKGTILTNQGNLMIIESINSKQPLIFTRVSVGSGEILDTENPKELISLKQNIKSINIPYYAQTKPGQLKIISSFTNETFTTNHTYRETGLWAKVGVDGNEKLYAYENKGVNGEPIPAFNGQNRMERGFAFYFSIKSASNIQVNIDTSLFVTVQHLLDEKNLLISEISKKSDLTYVDTELSKKASNSDNALKTKVKNRTGATNENYDVLRAINGTATGEYIQDITQCIGGLGYIDRITGRQFIPANLDEGAIRPAPIHGWTGANSEWMQMTVKSTNDSFHNKIEGNGFWEKNEITGIIKQYGTAAGSIIYFPKPFPNQCLIVLQQYNSGNFSTSPIVAQDINVLEMTKDYYKKPLSGRCNYMAIGY